MPQQAKHIKSPQNRFQLLKPWDAVLQVAQNNQFVSLFFKEMLTIYRDSALISLWSSSVIFILLLWSNRFNKTLFKTESPLCSPLCPIVHRSDWSTVPVTRHCRMAEPGTEEGCLLGCGLQWAFWELDIHCFTHRKNCRTICCETKHNGPSYWPQGHCPHFRAQHHIGFII